MCGSPSAVDKETLKCNDIYSQHARGFGVQCGACRLFLSESVPCVKQSAGTILGYKFRCMRLLSYKAFFTEIAFTGHISWQQKQEMHPFLGKWAFLLRRVMMWGGQLSMHLPQPMHFAVSTWG